MSTLSVPHLMHHNLSVATEFEYIRIRLDKPIKESLQSLCERKHISQQDAIENIVEFLLGQDDLLQSMLLRQVHAKNHAELSKIVLARLVEESAREAEAEKGDIGVSGRLPAHDRKRSPRS